MIIDVDLKFQGLEDKDRRRDVYYMHILWAYSKLINWSNYVQYHLADRRKDATEDPIDGIAIMSFDSEADMHEAWSTDQYKKAAKIRESIMRETAVGVHVASVDQEIRII